MKTHQLAKLFYLWGWKIRHDHYVSFLDYIAEMLRRDRVIIMEKEGRIEAIIFYYLTNDYEALYKKSTWETPLDNPDGCQIYIDKMICKEFTRDLLRSLQDAIEERFPKVGVGVWHRAPKDKCIKVYRRLLCTQLNL